MVKMWLLIYVADSPQSLLFYAQSVESGTFWMSRRWDAV